MQWPFREIQALDISARALVLTSYENRRHHEPGERRYHFELQSELPPRLAEGIAQWLKKPSRNANPDPQMKAFAEIPAKHKKSLGGSNGELRFSVVGIEFLTAVEGDARAWSWADIQTIANPDPYHFRVTGYLETYDFELKQPMPTQLFDRLWDSVYTRDLNLSSDKEVTLDR
jgi:hypothetical protein